MNEDVEAHMSETFTVAVGQAVLMSYLSWLQSRLGTIGLPLFLETCSVPLQAVFLLVSSRGTF